MTNPGDTRLTACPVPCAPAPTGFAVYRALSHDPGCTWATRTPRRCAPHNELLLPNEADCPTAGDPSADPNDPHNRLVEDF